MFGQSLAQSFELLFDKSMFFLVERSSNTLIILLEGDFNKRLGVVLLKILGHSAFVVIRVSGASFKQILHRE